MLYSEIGPTEGASTVNMASKTSLKAFDMRCRRASESTGREESGGGCGSWDGAGAVVVDSLGELLVSDVYMDRTGQ